MDVYPSARLNPDLCPATLWRLIPPTPVLPMQLPDQWCAHERDRYGENINIYIDKIVSKILHKASPVVDVEIGYQIIHGMWDLLYGNTYNLNMTLGGGNHRHIWVIIQYTLYTTIPSMPYDVPVYLGLP